MSQQPTTTENDSSGREIVDATLTRHGRKKPGRPGGVGLPIAQTLMLRSFETRRISLEVLIDGEWANQLEGRLNNPDNKISEEAILAVDRQAASLGSVFFEALIHAIQVGYFDASIIVDVTGYEKP